MDLKGENCTLCSKLLDSDSLTVTEDVLNLFKYLVETVNTTALQNVMICTSCLEKMKEAVNFKTLHLTKHENRNAETNQENISDGKYVSCYICRNATKPGSIMSLFNACYENVASYIIDKDVDCLVDPQICDTCHVSALNFQSMTEFLSVYDLNKPNNDLLNSEAIIEAIECKIDIGDNCLPDDSILNLDMTNQLKQEIQDFEELEEDLQKKQKELDLNVAYEMRPSDTELGSLSCEDQETILPQSSRNDSDLTNDVANIDMEYNESISSLKNEKHDDNDNFDELEMFKCSQCEFQAEHTSELYLHAITHNNLDGVDILQFETERTDNPKRHSIIQKTINEVQIFKSPNCEFQRKLKISMKQHMLTHKNINKVTMFKCQHCKYRTKYKSVLKRHQLTHKNINKVKTFKCQNCEFQSKYDCSLKRHMLSHKNINEVKMFKCHNCDFKTM